MRQVLPGDLATMSGGDMRGGLKEGLPKAVEEIRGLNERLALMENTEASGTTSASGTGDIRHDKSGRTPRAQHEAREGTGEDRNLRAEGAEHVRQPVTDTRGAGTRAQHASHPSGPAVQG
jgi:hypothetical protein